MPAEYAENTENKKRLNNLTFRRFLSRSFAFFAVNFYLKNGASKLSIAIITNVPKMSKSIPYFTIFISGM